MCEKNLYKEFHQGLEWLGPQMKGLEVMNCNEKDITEVNMQVIDYFSTFGCWSDREKNA